MTIVPEFEIGVWNAWILTAILFLFIMLSGLIPNVGNRITPPKEVSKIRNVMLIVFFALIIYSVFLPLKTGTAWLYIGLFVYVLGFAVSISAFVSIAATEAGKPFTTGIYRYSRHPIALGTALPFIGAGIASTSWLFLLLSVILWIISHFSVITEERATAIKFGDAYSEYMKKTPRWFGIPKS
jgi:protein-S-isoprenylcysteine O-methyltransferase Ste14